MSPPGADFDFRDPCEDDSCHDKGQLTFYCSNCDCSFCETCWDKQTAHKPKKRGFDGHPHEKIDRLIVERYRNIFEPSSSTDEQDALYKDEEDATWFGIGRNRAGDPVFEDYGRYTTLMAESLLPTPKVRYPYLASFIGQTGAGKSAVVKLLINYQDMKANRTAKAEFSSPLIGSVNDNIPVSADVHLYADPHTILTDTPLLYADCEGLEGGESPPKNELNKMRVRALENDGLRKFEKHSRKSNKVSRKLSWALGDKEKSKREFAVTELYPKVLYTFSDVVVFVLRNPKTFESTVLQKLISWASESFEKSLGQPALPHLIIVLNATDSAIDARQWDVAEATQKFFSDVETSIERIPGLQAQLAYWRADARSIKTTKDLLECYYSSITVVRIPAKGRYMLMDEQVAKLHTEIVVKCSQSHFKKKKVHMLSNSEDLQLYLQLAFDHFSQNLDEPFNFVKVALKVNPIPSDFSGNILKLAVAIKDHHPLWTLVKIFEHLSLMVASCIMLDIDRHRRLGTPKQLLEDYYMSYCEQAFDYFCTRHWPCKFMKRGSRCANPKSGHVKGHQNAKGKFLGKGGYDPSFSYGDDLWTWNVRLERAINSIQATKDDAEPSLKVTKSLTTLHLQNIKTFYEKIGSASNFQSHCTCFCCLREIPVHPLACGHILCSPCVRSYGVPRGREFMEMLSCPICQAKGFGRLIKFMSPHAGVRILCLDGGGMRGIVELEILKAIEEKLPPRIPIRNFFDLIVGTSTGGIIALGLGVEGWSVDECIKHFGNLCNSAFTPRELQGIWGLEQLSAMGHSFSKYKSKPLEEALKTNFSVSDQPLFGGQHSLYNSSVKVAVTSATEIGEKALLLANYNRSEKKGDHVGYCFERAEKPEDELKVWEAARATSAAPSFFKPFRSERTGRCYMDGALFHNNPVRVADLERRLIWPDSKFSPPDILLSIGTSCNSTTRREAQESLSTTSGLGGAQENVFQKGQKTTQMGKFIKIMKKRVENILDTEICWLEFMSDANARGHEDAKNRYWRINPDLTENPPALDDVKKFPGLQRRMHQIMKHADFQKQTGEIARRLVASSFYLEVQISLPDDFGMVFCGMAFLFCSETKLICEAEIQCKFPSASQELRHLGDYFKNMTTLNYQPYFIIGEKNSTSEPIQIIITQQLIQGMTMNASFELGPVLIPVSAESAIATISLSVVDGEELPISGFPRVLMAKNVVKELFPSSDEPGEHMKLAHASWHENFVSSSHTGESSHKVFPDLRRLSKKARLPIRNFLQEQLSKFQGEKDVSRKMWLLAEAVKELNDDHEDQDVEKELYENVGAGGPHDTILHTACMIGNYWLVKLQIEAGVDVAALDQHLWTALMVAKAQGHTNCVELISEHMGNREMKAEPQALPPSGLGQSKPKGKLLITGERLTAVANSSSSGSIYIHVSSDHPIPPHFQTFYYEIKILSSSKDFGMTGLGLCGPGELLHRLPGWKETSWAYHSDGYKYRGSLPGGSDMKYGGQYGSGDIVGCGINMRTGKIFFTKNGFTLGVAFGNVKGILFPSFGLGERGGISVNFGQSRFEYDIEAHDWAVGESAAAVAAENQGLGLFRTPTFRVYPLPQL